MAGPEYTYGGGYGYRPDRMMVTAGLGAEPDAAQQVGDQLADMLIAELAQVADPKARAAILQDTLDSLQTGLAAKVGANTAKLVAQGVDSNSALRLAIRDATANMLVKIYAQAAAVGIDFAGLGCADGVCGTGAICGACPIGAMFIEDDLGGWPMSWVKKAGKYGGKVVKTVGKVVKKGASLLKKAACSSAVQGAIGKAAGAAAGKAKDPKAKFAAQLVAKGAGAMSMICGKAAAPVAPVEPVEPEMPFAPMAMAAKLPWKWIGIGGGGLLALIILLKVLGKKPAAAVAPARSNPARRRRRRACR